MQSPPSGATLIAELIAGIGETASQRKRSFGISIRRKRPNDIETEQPHSVSELDDSGNDSSNAAQPPATSSAEQPHSESEEQEDWGNEWRGNAAQRPGTSNAEEPAQRPASSSAEQPDPESGAEDIVCVPNVAAIGDRMSDSMLSWLLDNFIWKDIAHYVLLTNGHIEYRDNLQLSPAVKLEMLIRLARERREAVCRHEQTHVLSDALFTTVRSSWETDCSSWMSKDTYDKWYEDSNQQWHQRQRRSFRSFLFQIMGCYEMALFFLVAPFAIESLELFKEHWERAHALPGDASPKAVAFDNSC